MITFKTIRWMNFLSTGHVFNEINITTHSRVLIAGKNGSGKSTVMDAFCYVLFNKAFRKINKPQLINSVTGKNCLVEVEFTVGRTEYLVRRGMKPNIFEIYRNGQIIEQSANSRDYQDILEKTILKTDYRTFCQIVILGNANYVPFMQLPAHGRRQIIESLLDIELFSVMNTLLKERASQNKNAISDMEHEIRLLKNTIELNEKHKRQVEQANTKNIEKKQKSITVNTRKIEVLNEKNKKITEKMEELSKKTAKLDEINEKMKKLSQADHLLANKCSTLKSEMDYYKKTDTCSTCKQDIDEHFKADILADLQSRFDTYNENKVDIESKQKKLTEQIEKYRKYANAYDELNTQIQKNTNEIALHLQLNRTLKDEIEELSDIDLKTSDSAEEKKKLKELKSKYEDAIKKREVYNIALMLLKDNGIKSQIIKQYIPVINNLLNANLEKLEFFCKFEFDENFEEKIKSRHRDEFSYASFSQGEKMRIDLALLFTWREIARMRNASPINLLILDEIMDGSLDDNGTEEFLDIISKFAPNNNIFVISHKHHQIADKFDKTIHFEKIKNFSKLS